MGSIWIPYWFDLDSIWIRYGFHMDSIWIPHWFQINSIWIPNWFHIDPAWISFGFQMISIWIPYWFPMDFIWIPYGILECIYMNPKQIPYLFHMDSVRILFGLHMYCTWIPYGVCVLRLFITWSICCHIQFSWPSRNSKNRLGSVRFLHFSYIRYLVIYECSGARGNRIFVWDLCVSCIYNIIDVLPNTIFLELAEIEYSFRVCVLLLFLLYSIYCHVGIFWISRTSNIRLGAVCFFNYDIMI